MPKNYAALRKINNNIAAKKRRLNPPATGETPMEDAEPSGDVAMGDDDNGARIPRNIGSNGATAGNSGGGEVMRGNAPLPIGMPIYGAKYTRTFTRQYHLRIFNELYSRRNVHHLGAKYNVLTPPIHELPVSHASFYLLPHEINRLRDASKVTIKKCAVQVDHATACLTFETSASATAIGNNNVGVRLVTLNPLTTQLRAGQFKQDQISVIKNVFHGIHAGNLSTQETDSTDFVGCSAEVITRNYSNKFEYQTIQSIPKKAFYVQSGVVEKAEQLIGQNFFPILRHVNKRINASMEEGVLLNWEYTPRDGVILANTCFTADQSARFSDNLQRLINHNTNTMNWQCAGGKYKNTTEEKTAIPGPIWECVGVDMDTLDEGLDETTDFTIHHMPFRSTSDPYFIPIERYTGHGPTERVPICAFGIEPLVAINEVSNVVTPLKCHVDLIVATSITLEIEVAPPGQEQPALTYKEWDLVRPIMQHCVQGWENVLSDPNTFPHNNYQVPMITAAQEQIEAYNTRPTPAMPNGGAIIPPSYGADRVVTRAMLKKRASARQKKNAGISSGNAAASGRRKRDIGPRDLKNEKKDSENKQTPTIAQGEPSDDDSDLI